MSKDCTEFSVSARLDALPGLLAWLDGIAGDLADGTRQRLRIVTEELFLNTVHHGRPGADLSITLALRQDGAHVTLIYRDTASSFDPAAVAPRDPASPVIGGFGLDIVRHLADNLRYRREANTNCIELEFTTPQQT